MTHSARPLSQSDGPAPAGRAGSGTPPPSRPPRATVTPSRFLLLSPGHWPGTVRRPRGRRLSWPGARGRPAPGPGHQGALPGRVPSPARKGALVSRFRAASGPLQRSLRQSAKRQKPRLLTNTPPRRLPVNPARWYRGARHIQWAGRAPSALAGSIRIR